MRTAARQSVAFALSFTLCWFLFVGPRSAPVQGQATAANGWAAVTGEKGGWDFTGP